MANYSAEDVQQALAQGLLSESDAAYLLDALGTQPSAGGAALGAIGGGLASAALGSAGGRFLGKGADALSEMAGMRGMDKTAGALANVAGSMSMPGMQTKIPGTELGLAPNRGSLVGAGALGGLGAVGGGFGGAYGMGSPGEGVGGEGASERDMLMRALIDPNVPAKEKKKILALLQNGQEAMAAAQDPSMTGGEMAGAGLGALAGGIGGLLGGQAVGNMLKEAASRSTGMGGKIAGAISPDIPFPQRMQTENIKSLQPMGVVGGVGLGAAGGWGGAEGAEALQARFSDPFAEA